MPGDDMLLPKVHPRHDVMHDATNEFNTFWEGLKQKHNLTISEELALLTDETRSIVAMCVRAERATVEKKGKRG